MVIARCAKGVTVAGETAKLEGPVDHIPVRAVFCLVSGEDDPGRHLRILAQLASCVEAEEFMKTWLAAEHEQDLKEVLLRNERFRTLRVRSGTPAEVLIGRALTEFMLPAGSAVALLGRSGKAVVPRGHMLIEDGDRLTIIGTQEALRELAFKFPEVD